MTLQQRYLELLRKSLINELYVENDARLLYTAVSMRLGKMADQTVLQRMGWKGNTAVGDLLQKREDGSPWWNVPLRMQNGEQKIVSFRNYVEFSHSMIGAKRMRNIEDCLDVIRETGIVGDLVETGVWRGGAAVFMRAYLETYGMPDRVVWAADSFEGLPVPTHPADQGFDYSAKMMPTLVVPLDEVQSVFGRYGYLDDRVKFLKGWFKDTLPVAPIERIALLRLDGDLYESTWDALTALYSKVVPGGFVLVDDYGDFLPCQRAVHDFRDQNGITAEIVRVDWTGVYWRKN
ncbi:MAG TPA: TylF/MycF/NovP-related O-methyltransferase [Usitatibacter sp.]|nr:TylF/MycF/NovP-related O-methyltransferase [Usitatibacter sp.]